MLLKVNKLSKNIKNKQILKNISFEIDKGECVALIGPNGAGKTTLFNILLGNKFASSGEVLVANLKAGSSKIKEILAVLNQENAVPEKIKVQELINFYRTIHENPLSEEEIDSILGFSKEKKNQLVSKLSGGQKRFLVFVLTLIGRPQILFLDEPTSAMDTSTRKRFWEIINILKEKGVTIVYSSHYIEEVEHTAERILILDKGELLRDTTPYALKAEKVEKYFTLPVKYEEVVKNLAAVYDVEVKKDNISFVTIEPEEVWESLTLAGCKLGEVEIQNRTLLTSLFNTTKEEK